MILSFRNPLSILGVIAAAKCIQFAYIQGYDLLNSTLNIITLHGLVMMQKIRDLYSFTV